MAALASSTQARVALVLVPVPLVGCVAVPIVDVVGMVVVGHGFVPAAFAVGVGVDLVSDVRLGRAFVPVVVVSAVSVAVVEVVSVVAVGDGDVSAVLPVAMGMIFVGVVSGRHG
jgi:hypothetical protein